MGGIRGDRADNAVINCGEGEEGKSVRVAHLVPVVGRFSADWLMLLGGAWRDSFRRLILSQDERLVFLMAVVRGGEAKYLARVHMSIASCSRLHHCLEEGSLLQRRCSFCAIFI